MAASQKAVFRLAAICGKDLSGGACLIGNSGFVVGNQGRWGRHVTIPRM
jgi:hypothetical protein